MSNEWKSVLALWLNGNDNGAYYSLKNESGEPVTIAPGETVYLSPSRTPVASKSVRVEQANNTQTQVDDSNDVADDIPF